MKFIFKLTLILFIFLVSILAFLPKEGLYNLLEKELEKQNIVISNEIREIKTLGIKVSTAELYYDGINTALVKEIDLTTFLFYTTLKIDTLHVSKEFKNMFPSSIKNIDMKHSILEYDKVDLKAKGDFGTFEGKILLLDRKIVGELKPSKIMKSKYRQLLKEFKLVEGKYKYEFKF